jgi:L-fuculose-phosphate aldolase
VSGDATQALRQAIIDAARGMNRDGLNRGRSGNVSARVPGGMLITPSAVPYDDLAPADLVALDLHGGRLDAGAGHAGLEGPDAPISPDAGPGARRPSTEWRLHAALYAARPDAGAILHAHPPFATTLACLRRHIPPFHYMVAVAGGDSIRCAPYATFGSAELADHAVAALEGRTACLLANHGMVALGQSPGRALELAVEVETLAEQYWRALAVGAPVLLTAAEMKAALAAFRDYAR